MVVIIINLLYSDKTILINTKLMLLLQCIQFVKVCCFVQVRALLTSFINTVKKLIKTRIHDFDTKVLWLSNTLRFLHNLKQYSGEKAFKVIFMFYIDFSFIVLFVFRTILMKWMQNVFGQLCYYSLNVSSDVCTQFMWLCVCGSMYIFM